ncbi:MAG: hypothetical protein CM1200mP30_18580 [Pseudomonadota bacterium]|nr:MAG: hypothetical protein CM1200mP30_18580 [Pseudomonadota bacterium]
MLILMMYISQGFQSEKKNIPVKGGANGMKVQLAGMKKKGRKKGKLGKKFKGGKSREGMGKKELKNKIPELN